MRSIKGKVALYGAAMQQIPPRHATNYPLLHFGNVEAPLGLISRPLVARRLLPRSSSASTLLACRKKGRREEQRVDAAGWILSSNMPPHLLIPTTLILLAMHPLATIPHTSQPHARTSSSSSSSSCRFSESCSCSVRPAQGGQGRQPVLVVRPPPCKLPPRLPLFPCGDSGGGE